LLGERFRVAKQVGEVKKSVGRATLDEERFVKMLEERIKWADDVGIDNKFTTELFGLIHDQSLMVQK
jgi:chorismate mutase